MSLRITKLIKNGDASKEVLSIQAIESVNLKGFEIVDRTFNQDETISNIFRHRYVFPNHNVKKGEWIRLYSGKGTNKTVTNRFGVVVHLFYWNSEAPIWNDKESEKVELLYVTLIDTKLTENESPIKKTVFKLNLRPKNLKHGGKK